MIPDAARNGGCGKVFVESMQNCLLRREIVLEIAPILCIAKFNFAGKNLSVGGLCILAGNTAKSTSPLRSIIFDFIKNMLNQLS